jgi:hypothetical protein
VNLRDHPKLQGAWPSPWASFYGRGERHPSGEDPSRLLSVEKSDRRKTITLRAEFEGREVTGTMTIEDSQFRARLYDTLQEHVGKSIREIGSLDIPVD